MQLLWACLLIGLCATFTQAQSAPASATSGFRHCAGTYAGAPRRANKHVDVSLLLEQLKDLHADSYNWLVWGNDTDWEDLKGFLPLARGQGLRVWVTLVPPSESPPKTKWYAEPYRLDYERWAVEIAKLSVQHPNLVAWSIDDFTHNLAFFTPEKTAAMLKAARVIDPKLAFVPCCYFPAASKPAFAKDYGPLLDGVLFPYRNESRKANLTDADAVTTEVARLRELFGPKVAIIIDVYSSAHSRLGPSTPEYVRKVMTNGLHAADGVMVYCTPDPKRAAEKFAVVKDVFAARSPAAAARDATDRSTPK
jgi:hypothetical protein